MAKYDNKTYPDKMLHVDIKRLPLLKNEMKPQAREYLFVGIDDFLHELYAGIYLDKSQFSSAQFLQIENKSLNALLIFNTVKPHKAIPGKTPYECLDGYFNHEV